MILIILLLRTSLCLLNGIFEEDMNRNDAAAEMSDKELQHQMQHQFLREHIELKGFLPLGQLYDVI